MPKSAAFRPFAMIAMMFSLLLALTVVSFSKPVVLDDVTAANCAQHYVPNDSILETVVDTGNDYQVKFNRNDAGMDITYTLTVNKASQEVTNMHMELNNNGVITINDTNTLKN